MSYIFLVPGNDFVFSVFAFVTSFVKKVAKLGCAAELREHPSSSPKLSVNRRVSGTGNFHGACVVSHAKKKQMRSCSWISHEQEAWSWCCTCFGPGSHRAGDFITLKSGRKCPFLATRVNQSNYRVAKLILCLGPSELPLPISQAFP